MRYGDSPVASCFDVIEAGRTMLQVCRSADTGAEKGMPFVRLHSSRWKSASQFHSLTEVEFYLTFDYFVVVADFYATLFQHQGR